MKYYLIESSDVDTASKSGIVAIWLDDYNQSGVSVTDLSTKVFGDKEVVDIVLHQTLD